MPRVIECVVEYESQEPCKTAEEMWEICCEEKPALQCCESGYEWSCGSGQTLWGGYSHAELLEKHHPGLSDYEKNFIRIELKPRKHPCGYLVTEYDVSDGRCCDSVEDLAYDWDESADAISPGSTGIVYVLNGKGPFIWSLSGSGFRFQASGRQSLVTESRGVLIELVEGGCGSGEIRVTDECFGTAIGRVRSTSGGWVVVSDTTQEGLYNSPLCTVNGKQYIDDWCIEPCESTCTGNAGAPICPDPGFPDACWVEGRKTWEWQC